MSYGVLVQRFGGYVRERHERAPVPAEAPRPFPESLQAEREIIAHHMIPLALLSRADGDYAQSEQHVIVEHCVGLLERIGVKPSIADRVMLEKYIADLRPTLMQLDPALKRLEKEPAESLASFLCAARKVVAADGNVDPAETRLLDELRADLADH